MLFLSKTIKIKKKLYLKIKNKRLMIELILLIWLVNLFKLFDQNILFEKFKYLITVTR